MCPETIKTLNEKINETKDNLKEVATDVVDAGQQVVTSFGEAVTEIGSVVSIATETAIEGVKEISVATAIETGKALADAKKNEELLEVIRAKQQLQSQLDAELQRQIRDDVALTFEERIKANEELGRILDEQLEKEQAVADEKVRIAKLELDTNQASVELQTKYQQALLEQIDIEERISGQRSEQLTNTNALIQEQRDALSELNLIGKEERELELASLEQDFQDKLRLAEKSGQDINKVTEHFAKLRNEIEFKYRMQNVDNIAQTINMASGLFAEGTAMAKVTGVAQATIDTYKAVNMALASAPPPLNFIQAGLTLATGIKNVKEIMSVKTEKPAPVQAPSGESIPSGAEQPSSVPDTRTGGLSLAQQFSDNFMQQQPVQAYVVEQDVTNAQQINTMISQKATL
jgi:hypothetical protein